VISGLDDAIVLNWTLDSTGATEVVTGTGFAPIAMLTLDSARNNNVSSSAMHFSIGCATSSSLFWSVGVVGDVDDTMTSGMRFARRFSTDACVTRLATNGTVNSLWDVDSFDSDGCTLGVVDAPDATFVAPLLFVKGGVWEAGNKAKATGTGNDTFTLANGSLTPLGILLGTAHTTTANTLGDGVYSFCFGAGSTANPTRGSAVNNAVGITGPEAINTQADTFRATDSIIEELTGGEPPVETSEAWFDTASAGSFIIDWAVNGGSAALIGYLAVGAAAVADVPSAQPRSFVPVAHASHW
jgi:hypothetical protein